MTIFSNVLKKPLFLAHFWAIFRIFGAKKILLENPALSRTTSYGVLASGQNFEKTNDTIPIKHLDRQKDRRTDRSYFIRPFQLLLRVQKCI